MRQAGRVSIPLIIAVVFVAIVVGLLSIPSNSPAGSAGEFMVALSRGDSKKLAELSYMPGRTTDQAQDEWKQTLSASKHYLFLWNMKNTVQPSDDDATVMLDFTKNFGSGSDYAENFQLPMVKRNGKWLVDVRAINRDFYPFLPR